jgi:transcriptional regulator with XRE-family HTH domain
LGARPSGRDRDAGDESQIRPQRDHGTMPIRQGAADLGNEDAVKLRRELGQELRATRAGLGLSQRSVARLAMVSPSRLGRIERGETAEPSIAVVCRAGRVLGLTASIRFFPSGSPMRDAASLRLADRFKALIAPPVRLRGETPLPGHDDLRAWDGILVDDDNAAFTEYESRFGDLQALTRRIGLKLRDDPRAGVVVLVVARTRHNVRVLAEHREALRGQFPLDGASIARSLRAGRVPRESGIIVL